MEIAKKPELKLFYYVNVSSEYPDLGPFTNGGHSIQDQLINGGH